MLDRWLRSHPLTIPLGARHNICCGDFLLRNITSSTWEFAEEGGGKDGFRATEVGAVAYFATSSEEAPMHAIRGEVLVSHFKSYEHMGSVTVRVLTFPSGEGEEEAPPADDTGCISRRNEPRPPDDPCPRRVACAAGRSARPGRARMQATTAGACCCLLLGVSLLLGY